MATAPVPMEQPNELDDQEAVAANIRALMGRHRVSQSRLAAAVGLSTRGMSERLNGHTNFTVRELGKVARFFGKSLGDIVSPMVLATLAGLYVTRIEHPPWSAENQGQATADTYLQLSLFRELIPTDAASVQAAPIGGMEAEPATAEKEAA